jgi:hypothetical protein
MMGEFAKKLAHFFFGRRWHAGWSIPKERNVFFLRAELAFVPDEPFLMGIA